MKKLFFVGLIFALLIQGCQSRQIKETIPMKGAWKVISWERWSNDTLEFTIPGTISGSEIKIWSDKYFVFSGSYKRDTTIIDNYGGGTFKLDGNHYEETILYWPKGNKIPAPIKLLIEIKGDTLIQTWPLDENWQLDKSNHNVQKLIRLE
jgi:hypothetical protein